MYMTYTTNRIGRLTTDNKPRHNHEYIYIIHPKLVNATSALKFGNNKVVFR